MARRTERSAWLRRGVGLAVGVAMIPLAIAFVAVAPGHPWRPADDRASSADLRSPNRTAAPTPTPTSTSAPVAASTDEPRTGPGIDAAGIYLQFTARADGKLDVTERIVLSGPVDRVAFSPPSASAAGPAFSGSRPVVLGLQVEAGGQPVANVPARVVRDLEIRLKRKSAAFTLRYQLSGTTVMSVPSTAHRALAFLQPLSARVDTAIPVQMLAGSSALNLTCPQMSGVLQACARGSVPRLRVETGMTAADATVIVQLDLPQS